MSFSGVDCAEYQKSSALWLLVRKGTVSGTAGEGEQSLAKHPTRGVITFGDSGVVTRVLGALVQYSPVAPHRLRRRLLSRNTRGRNRGTSPR